MSQFINYKKRSVTLPPGCKDLIDLLRRREEAAVTRGESFTGGLSEISTYVAKVFKNAAEAVVLMMSTPDGQLTLNVERETSGTTAAFVVFPHGTHQEKAMRTFFLRRGLKAPRDSGMPVHFSSNLPVQCIYNLAPLPSEPALVSDVAIELFRNVCGLDEESEIRFRYYELTTGM